MFLKNTPTEREDQEDTIVSLKIYFHLHNAIEMSNRLLTNTMKSLSPFHYTEMYSGDRRGQNIEGSNTRQQQTRHPHHRNYPLPLPPTSEVVTNSLRKRNRYYQTKKQPVSVVYSASFEQHLKERSIAHSEN